MRSVTLRRLALLGVAGLPLLAACGDDEAGASSDDGTSSTRRTSSSGLSKDASSTTGETTTTTAATTTTGAITPPSTGGRQVDATISLTVEVSTDTGPLRSGSLTCSSSGASGTGHLADPAAAEAACTLLRDDEGARHRLLHGPDPDRICTMIYGGPEVARVRGEIDGQPVDATVDRTDGCAIAEWDTLAPLVGAAGS